MKLSDFSIKRSVTTAMIILMVLLIGSVALSRLSLDLFPDITFPGAAIVTTYEGVGSEEIENLITKEIESSVATVEGVKSITSTSSRGSSTVVVEFNWGRDMDFAVQDLREQVDLVNSMTLPEDADSPMIFKFDPAMIPIMVYGVSAQGLEIDELKEEVEDELIPRLERISGVAQVNMQGGLTREIIVALKRDKLSHYNLDFNTITNIVRAENINVSAGDVLRGDKEFLVRTVGKFSNLDEIRNINIPVGNGQIKLSDVAEVRDGFADLKTLSRTNGKRSLSLAIQKQTDANTVEVAGAVRAEIDQIQNDYPNYSFSIAMDQSEFIEKSIASVSQNAILGGLLAVIILFLFLRNIRSTIIIATAMPISIIGTFILMYFADVNLNVISLGGLALGVGMLVDNGVVVLENIYRYRSMGEGKIEAAREGSSEVGMAIAASTVTTVVVFLPIVFVEGMAGQLFRDLALTVAFSLIASLMVALTLIPMLASKILKIKPKELARNKKEGRIKQIYRKALTKSLKHRWVFVVLLVVLLVGSFALVPQIGFEFMPSTDQGSFSVSYELPVGTALSRSNEVSTEIESVLTNIEEVETVIATVGSGGQMMSTSTSSHLGTISVQLVDLAERDRSTAEVMEEIRQSINLPDVDLSVEEQQGFSGGGAPVNVKLFGDDLDVLEQETAKATAAIEDIEGLREIDNSLSEGQPEYQIKVNRSIASRFGLNVSQIANTVRTAINGNTSTRYEVAGDEYDIRVRLQEDQIEQMSQVPELNIQIASGEMIPLSRVASLEITEGPVEILRKDQERHSEITADIHGVDLGTVMEQIQSRLSELELPDGYRFSYEGEFADMQESFSSLGMAFGLAIILIYMVMASQFESLVHPFTIMFTIPLAVIGVIFGMYLTNSIVSVASILGLITLAGIVVNNAIVMVDYINQLRRSGTEKIEAIITAGTVRLRPIMMTALTTILGLLPIAMGIGEGSESTQPMGIVIVSGLTFATFLTLFVIPIFYFLVTDLRTIVVAKVKGITKEEASKLI
ncbi:efflux RND transporter permease subunit [Halanaerobium congolense]|uniref:HAE1 family hydrophobic/amphiphilic exporter-1 n=1 Tax=Halanaerobium congolense TaxID=54121 RepID=A0A1G9X8V6_9FIRM|nr:efflux RND transporter permease subunit [Halanaerobium congolense]PXV68660.1 HAE1 family hydrophobic/amphiphilic exporter-1 [Halanaerobium congolense]TDS30678.1 HAE1 family hydrophobic/amphiphilic exporter-1 [Halanaerobium congolense]SDH46435.1 hydrophobic/amphiphilic exporter-1, HAE1 family [Halanaerobium congolense]SDK96653.1 hydrophobic/amphiphilic exporter-1, HAE1 family [Halanaerobium congolense]SDM93222.1 hydrophobic/amphiphilic exporter-1, HAE1 family [Halanaerobium congolense]